MTTQQRQAVFREARNIPEGSFLTPRGDQIQTVYVDLSGEVERRGLCLVEATKPQHSLATAQEIRLSRPSVLRDTE